MLVVAIKEGKRTQTQDVTKKLVQGHRRRSNPRRCRPKPFTAWKC
jgi:hypothetical protein